MTDMDAFTEFLKTVKPYVLGLSSSSTELDRKSYWKQRSDQIERVLFSEYVVSDLQPGYFDVIASYSLNVMTVGQARGTLLLRIDCKYYGHFHAHAPIERAHAEEFARKDCWVIFWPYFRQFVSDTTARMSIPPELLPLGLGPGAVTALRANRAGKKQLPAQKRKATKTKKTESS